MKPVPTGKAAAPSRRDVPEAGRAYSRSSGRPSWRLAAQCLSLIAALSASTFGASPSGVSGETPVEPRAWIEKLSHDEPLVREEAAARLAWMGEDAREAVPALKERLHDEDPIVRATAAQAIWQITQDHATAVPVLAGLANSERTGVRLLAANTLGEIGPAASAGLPALRQALQTSDDLVRVHVAEAIARISPGDSEATEVLTAGLEHPNGDVRCQTVYALSAVPSEKLQRMLAKALDDSDRAVRSAASTMLEMFPQNVQRSIAALQEQEQQQQQAEPPEKGGDSGTTDADPEKAGEDDNRQDDNRQNDDGRGGDEGEEPIGIDANPIADVGLDVAPGQGRLPEDHAGPRFAKEGVRQHVMGTSRTEQMTVYAWEPAAVCHGPLQFEEINLERYGYSAGHLQPVFSAANFFLTAPLLPYKMSLHHPTECIYTLGHHRPGSCVPFCRHRTPLKLKPAAVETMVVMGLFYAIP